MPIEPPPSRWSFPPLDEADADGPIAIGGDLEPATLLTAYRRGLFPMPIGRGATIGWWSPDPRGVLPVDGLRMTRSLRQSVRRFEVTTDRCFGEVVRCCADPRRPNGWITGEFERAYTHLHDLGWAHSVETWRDGELVGGLYGVSIGGFFAGESMFHRATDASKVALVHLVGLLAPVTAALLDVQWHTPHLGSLGVVEIPRDEYLRRLGRAIRQPAPDF